MVVTVAFMGYLVAAWPGATLAAFGAYLPSFLIILGAAPFYHRVAAHEGVRNFVKGVSAAAVGALAGASYLMLRPAWQEPLALGLGLASLALLLWRRGLPEYLPILGSGLLALGIDFAMRSV
jgi:chromate transporter